MVKKRGTRDARGATRGVLVGIASGRCHRLGRVAWLALAIAACSGPSARVATDASDGEQVAARIRQVEQGLLPAIVIDGRPLPAMALEARMRAFNVPGVSIAIVNGGRIEWAKGYGVARAGGDRAIDSMTLFQAASISKPVAALGALALVEQGRLALDEDVNIRLTSWRVPSSDIAGGEQVTLRRLVSHNAGLTVHGFPGYARGVAVPSAVQVLDGVPPANTAPVRIDLVPGTRWRYSGGGFTVVQQLMSDVAGRPFAAVMEELVLRPLGMASSTYMQPLPESLAGRAAHAHTRQGQPIAGDWHTYPEQAAAGLWTTPSDLARMILGVQRAAAGAPNALLSPTTTREMLRVQAGEYGLGFGLDGAGDDRVFSHGGSNAGFRALFVGFVEAGRGAVVMTNADLGGALIEEIMRAIAQAYDWPMYRPESRTLAAIDSSTLRALAGRYRLESPGAPDRMLEVSLDGGALRAMLPNWIAPRTLYAMGPARFFMLESPVELAFEHDGAGSVSGVVMTSGAQRTRLVRVE